jgi:hypothetical protein
LPQGALVDIDGQAFLLWTSRHRRWSFGGDPYSIGAAAAPKGVTVLTPELVVRAFANGFTRSVHETLSQRA